MAWSEMISKLLPSLSAASQRTGCRQPTAPDTAADAGRLWLDLVLWLLELGVGTAAAVRQLEYRVVLTLWS